MYLKSIKIYGFKSFADKVEINLNENINAIVGPNGSGKSNIVDAVRWVLGEQSIKSLRGDNSSDVIFSGSKSRKPLNSASVTLVFDNSDSYLPINYNEVSIKRIMYRSLESEYYLNNEKCRLKDIYDLLTESFTGRDSFNIISQGKIDEILSTKPTDRRTIFESAAGVLKYKKRKLDAMKKLDRTNTNIDRVNDIISELETNLTPLEAQYNDALKYKDYKDKLTNTEVSLIRYDIDNYTKIIKTEQKDIESLNDEIILLSNNISNTELDLIGKKDKLKSIDENLKINQDTLITLTKEIEQTSADIRVLKERRKYRENKDKISENIINIKKEILENANSINNINNSLDNMYKNKEDISTIIEDDNSLYIKLKNSITNINKTITDNKRKITDLKYKIEYLESNIYSNNSIPIPIKKIFTNPRITGYHNIIGKLIKTDEIYNLAITTSLGGSVNYLVVNTTKDASEMVKYLKENKLGRATFYPLDVIKPRYIENAVIDKLRTLNGFIDIASNLVNYDSKYDNIIKNRLGNIIIVTDIESGNNISKQINNKYKIVTLDGQEINIGGSITGGSSINANIMNIKYELDNNKKQYEDIVNNTNNLEEELNTLDNKYIELEDKIHNNKLKYNDLLDTINTYTEKLNNLTEEKEELRKELNDLNLTINNKDEDEIEKLLSLYYKKIEDKDNLTNKINLLNNEKNNLNDEIVEKDSLFKKLNTQYNLQEKEIREKEVNISSINMKVDNLLLTLTEEYNMTYENTKKYNLDIEVEDARSLVKDIKDKIKRLGYVNLGAIEEYKRVKTRYDFLTNQKNDLYNANNTLLEIISEMDKIMKEKFQTTFNAIKVEFKKVFREMFNGGDAELSLTDPSNILETGIEIEAVPSGKNLKSLSLLSGGERTFTAISLLFAILNVRPVPFCLLDEVEAALDDANVESFCNYLNKYKNKTQFILITHKKKTMEYADVLYGITMQESGVSKLVSVKLEDLKKENNKDENI